MSWRMLGLEKTEDERWNILFQRSIFILFESNFQSLATLLRGMSFFVLKAFLLNNSIVQKTKSQNIVAKWLFPADFGGNMHHINITVNLHPMATRNFGQNVPFKSEAWHDSIQTYFCRQYFTQLRETRTCLCNLYELRHQKRYKTRNSH